MERSRESINWSLITAEADELFSRKSKGCRVLFFRSNDDLIRPIFNRVSSDSSCVQEHQSFPEYPFLDFPFSFHVSRSRIRFYPNRKIHRYRFVHFVIFFTIFRSIGYLWSRKCLIPWCNLEMEKKN